MKKIFKKNKVEITIRLVSIKEITYLNKKYRKKNVPTNVLSFPSTENINIKHQFSNYIGDIILSPNYINKEALLLKKNRLEHWAHIIIHSALHLLHYTHKNKKSRNIMQNIEKKIMIQLGFDDPYKTSNIN